MADESIWKKEISFGRKRKDAEQPEEQNGDEPTSIWKKEISFGRKKNAAPDPEPVDVQPSAEEPADDEEPAWTRAVSFGRKAEPEPEPESVVEDPAPPQEETWTRAVSFGRKAEQEPDAEEPPAAADETRHVPGTVPESGPEEAVASESEAPPELVVVTPEPVEDTVESEPLALGPEPVEEEEVWRRAVSFGRRPEQEPPAEEPSVVADETGHVPGTVPGAGPEEAVASESEAPPELVVVTPGPVEDAVEAEPVAVALEPVEEPEVPAQTWSAQPAPPPVEPEPVAVAPEPVEEPEVPAQTWSAQPAPPPVEPDPVEPAQPEPVAAEEEVPATAPAVHAPVTAEQLPPVEADEEKVPFWRKEIGGKKKAKAPKKKKAEAVAAVAVTAAEADKTVPFWKKEIGGKKKDKAPKKKAEAVAAAAVPATEPGKTVPFWKKEIGGKKKDKVPKAERLPKQPKEKKQKQPKVKAARGSRGAKRITGLKIGASQLAAARVANNGSAELLQVARTPLEPGIVVGGELRDPDALAEALKDFFAKNNLPKKGVRLGIANNRIGVRTFDIAGIGDEKQLTNAIRFRAQETLPIPIDEAVLDYQVLGDGTSEDGQPTKRVLLVVAYRELIDRYVGACKKAGISLLGIDLEAFALLRALQAPQAGADADSDSALVAVAIGHDRSTFAVSDGRVCEYTRVLEWGGSALNVALARALDAAPSEVDGIKRALALTDEMVPEGLTAEQAQKARDSMRRAIQTFARELVSSLQYYQNQPGSLGIGEIVLTGGTAHLAGLAGELERLIGVRVRVGDPLGRMKVSKKVGEAEQVGSLAVAIGLGIED
jgi:type IV pilus assembly protein PilM